MSHVQAQLAAPRSAPFLCARRRFFSLCTRLLRQITGGACLYMPQDSHWLASFEVIPPPSYFCRGQKNENFKGRCAPTLTFEKNLRHTTGFFLLFWLFLSEVLSRRSRLSWMTSDPAQIVQILRPKKCVFSAFFRRWVWQDFVTPISTFANIDGSLPTNSTTLNRLR